MAEEKNIDQEVRNESGEQQAQAISLFTVPVFAYNNGFADGALQTPEASHFERFSKAHEEQELTKKLLKRTQKAIFEKREELAFTKGRIQELERLAIDKKQQAAFTTERLEKSKEEVARLSDHLESAQSQHDDLKPEYGWLNSIILLVIGTAFVVTDILISQNIFQHYLEFGIADSWILGLSIALTGFALKPAIDRIFERPYTNSGRVIRNHTFLIINGLLVLLLLGMLGYIRTEAFQSLSGNANEDNTSKIDLTNILNPNSANTTTTTNAPGIEEQLSSPLIYTIFTLSAVLFVLVGALCLSIGFKSADILWARYVGRRLVRKLERSKSYQESRVFELGDVRQKLIAEFEKAQMELERLPAIEDLQLQLNELSEEEIALQKILAEATALGDTSWYKVGRSRGLKYNLSGETFVSPMRLEQWVVPYGMQSAYNGNSRKIRRTTKYTRPNSLTTTQDHNPDQGEYLYEQIRNAIALHNSKTNKVDNNGSKF